MLKTDFPGLGISIAAVCIGFLIIRFSIRFFHFVTGSNAADYGKAASSAERTKALIKSRQSKQSK